MIAGIMYMISQNKSLQDTRTWWITLSFCYSATTTTLFLTCCSFVCEWQNLKNASVPMFLTVLFHCVISVIVAGWFSELFLYHFWPWFEMDFKHILQKKIQKKISKYMQVNGQTYKGSRRAFRAGHNEPRPHTVCWVPPDTEQSSRMLESSQYA